MSCEIPFFNIVFSDNRVPHVSQILAGFQLLKEKKKIDFSFIIDSKYIKSNYLHTAIVEIQYCNKYFAYDMGDGYQSMQNLIEFDKVLDRVNIYFKRSCLKSFNDQLRNRNKIKALGLNYLVTTKSNPFDQNIFGDYKINGVKSAIKFFYDKIKRKIELNNIQYKNFERDISIFQKDECKIIFQTRLWDLKEIDNKWLRNVYHDADDCKLLEIETKLKNGFHQINNQRIEIINTLKKEYGSKFIGGIQDSEFSRNIAPELIIDNSKSNRYHFMNLLKNNSICISTIGLHNSIGWKFAEYVAAHKAIISDKLFYEIPGDFKVNQNYLEFISDSSLLSNVDLLLNNFEIKYKIELANFKYYHESLRPDMLVLNSLKYIIPELEKLY